MKEWLKINWFKLATILVILIIGLAYIAYLNTREANHRVSEIRKELQSNIESTQRLEIENKKYLADRKNDCLAIYETESKMFNNVRGWRFSEEEEVCYLRYTNQNPSTEAECDTLYKIDGKVEPIFLTDWLLCKDGEFENSF